MIDARDLAGWIVRAAEGRVAGTYNAVDHATTRETMFATCVEVAGSDAELVWVDGDFLAANEVGEWMELPLWLHDEEHRGMLAIDPAAAFAAGLETRPLAETARDTLAWVRSGEAPAEVPAGLAREKERSVLDAWLSKE